MKTKLLTLFLLAGSSMFAGVFVGFGVGVPARGYYVAAPPPPPRVVAYAPAYVRPGYTWVRGSWYPVGRYWRWRDGYWARRPYVGAYWVAPRYHRHRYYAGYWRRR